MAIAWPTSTLRPIDIMFARRTYSRTGGRTITGIEQIVQSSSEYWIASLAFKVQTEDQALTYRSLQAQTWGRSKQWIIPACPQIGIPPDLEPVDFSFSSDFSIDFSLGSSAPSGLSSESEALVTTAALIGATSLAIRVTDSRLVLKPGMYFSIGNQLYLIGTASGSFPYWTMTFRPKLRVAAPLGTSINFSNPKCLMKLTSDISGDLNLNMLRFSDLSLDFVEAI